MATIREGNQTILLIVDMQAGVMAELQDAERVIAKASLAVDRARNENVPVIWVQHENDEMPKGSPQWQLASGLQAAEGEVVVGKGYNSSFEETELENILTGLSATHIALAGASTNWCVRATAYAALERGYDLTLISDAHGTENLEPGDGSKIAAADVVLEFNTVMTWLRYPGRRSGTATAAEIDFTKP
ncbi:isochorismatase family protein [bacterium]|nr:isochorismatase family protein [bacterium]